MDYYLGENVEKSGIKLEKNFGLENDFPEITFVDYNKESETANIEIKRVKYEVLWDNELNEPKTKISDKTGKVFLIIPNKNSEKGVSLLCEINGKIKIIDEIYKEGDFLVSKELDLYNVSFQEHKEVKNKVSASIADIMK